MHEVTAAKKRPFSRLVYWLHQILSAAMESLEEECPVFPKGESVVQPDELDISFFWELSYANHLQQPLVVMVLLPDPVLATWAAAGAAAGLPWANFPKPASAFALRVTGQQVPAPLHQALTHVLDTYTIQAAFRRK